MSNDFFMIDETAMPPGRWFPGDYRSTDFQDRKRLDQLEPCKGVFTIDPGDGGRALDFSLTAFGLPIASVPLAEAIAKVAGNDIHLVPAQIKGYGEYRFIQCLKVLDCVEESRSEFQTFNEDAPSPSRRGEYSDFSRLVVDPARIPPGTNMFLLARWRVRPIVSGALKKVLDQSGDLGVNFTSVT